MSSLMASASMQSMTEIAENSGGTGRTIAQNRSVSEPEFGRTSKQVLAKRNLKTLISGYVEFERSYGISPLVSFEKPNRVLDQMAHRVVHQDLVVLDLVG